MSNDDKTPLWKSWRLIVPLILVALAATGLSLTMADGKLKIEAEVDLKEAAGLLAVDAGDAAMMDEEPAEPMEDDDSATP